MNQKGRAKPSNPEGPAQASSPTSEKSNRHILTQMTSNLAGVTSSLVESSCKERRISKLASKNPTIVSMKTVADNGNPEDKENINAGSHIMATKKSQVKAAPKVQMQKK